MSMYVDDLKSGDVVVTTFPAFQYGTNEILYIYMCNNYEVVARFRIDRSSAIYAHSFDCDCVRCRHYRK